MAMSAFVTDVTGSFREYLHTLLAYCSLYTVPDVSRKEFYARLPSTLQERLSVVKEIVTFTQFRLCRLVKKKNINNGKHKGKWNSTQAQTLA